MNFIPWRLRNLLSEHFPLAYHLAVNMGVKGNVAAVWDRRLAENWETMDWPAKISIITEKVDKQAAILDIACGTGSILRGLRGHGYTNLHGFDSSTYALQRLRAEGFDMHEGWLPKLPFANQTFDVVIASQILEHMIRRSTFARELQRVLKPGGIAFVFVPNNCLGPIDEPSHVTKYTKETLASFLAKFFQLQSIEVVKDPNYEITVLFALVGKPLPELG